MRNEAPVSPKHTSTTQPVPRRRRTRVYFVAAVVLIALTVILAFFFAGFFTLEAEVVITASKLRSGDGLLSNYIWVAVDVSLYNPRWNRRIVAWAEITDQPTQVSFSKAQSVDLDFRESKDVTIEFTLDSLMYNGEFTYCAWLTYPTSRD